MRHLSKADFLHFLTCPKLSWTAYNLPQMLTAPTPSAQHRMQEGILVEECARQLFPGALLIAHDQPFEQLLAQSKESLIRPPTTPLFNALLNANELIAESDILVPAEDEWDLYEVKSSTSPKPEYLPDIAFQRYVAGKMGIRIRRCFLVLVNGKYVRSGKLNPKHLFQIGDVTEGVQEYGELQNVEAQVESALLTCHQENCPEIAIGEQCPSDCPLRNICWNETDSIPNNIFTLYGLRAKRAWGWFRDNIIKNTDIPADYPLTERQKIQVRAEKTGQLHVNKGKVKAFLNGLQYPLALLDFETFASPIPLINNSSPYQMIPFQYSLHVIERDLNEEPRHESWIWNEQIENDPRMVLLMRLQSLLGSTGSIVAYNSPFEKTILKQAVKRCPEYEEWAIGIHERFVDLLLPFRNFAMYHPKQHGSCSLKDVLPALTGQGYEGLEIGDGEMASREFLKIVKGEVKGNEVEDIRRRLEEYCGLDTMAMVEILRKMKEATQP